MKRKNKVVSEKKVKKQVEPVLENQKPLWRKTTTGTLIIRKPIKLRVKPKQEVFATKEELGRHAFTDFELVKNGTRKYKIKKGEEKTPVTSTDPPKEEYKVVHVEDGKHNVVSPTGKVMNEDLLSVEEAKKLKAQLEAEKVKDE